MAELIVLITTIVATTRPMHWLDQTIVGLEEHPCCGYQQDAKPATEPTALAALALAAHGRFSAAIAAADWLTNLQEADGSVGIRQDEPIPRWATSLAVMAWLKVDAIRYARQIEAATNWTLSLHGKPMERSEDIGHNTMLVAWPWIEGTHSWIEPTALHVCSLKATGHSDHRRTREAVRVLIDRQLPTGGCNYGNKEVLGQALLPHVQPTGLAMMALASEVDGQRRVAASLAYLEKSLSANTTTASLCWGVLGLAAHKRRPANADLWLESAYGRTIRRDRSPHKLALLALAATAKERIV